MKQDPGEGVGLGGHMGEALGPGMASVVSMRPLGRGGGGGERRGWQQESGAA